MAADHQLDTQAYRAGWADGWNASQKGARALWAGPPCADCVDTNPEWVQPAPQAGGRCRAHAKARARAKNSNAQRRRRGQQEIAYKPRPILEPPDPTRVAINVATLQELTRLARQVDGTRSLPTPDREQRRALLALTIREHLRDIGA